METAEMKTRKFGWVSVLAEIILWTDVLMRLCGSTMRWQLCNVEHDSLLSLDFGTFSSYAMRIGGLSDWMGQFLIQFFALPFWAVAAYSLPLVIASLSLFVLLRRISFPLQACHLAFGAAFFMVLASYDAASFFSGHVALAMSLLELMLISLIPGKRARTAAFVLGMPVAFFLWGAASAVYTAAGLIVFLRKDNLWPLAALAVNAVLAICSGMWHILPSFQFAFTPRAYYSTYQEVMPFYQWLGWIYIAFLLLLARFLKARNLRMGDLASLLASIVIAIAFGASFISLYSKCKPSDTQKTLWELSDCAYRSDWEAVLATVREMPEISNHLFLNYAYLAMGHLGTLGDDAFSLPPHDANSLILLKSEDKDSYAVRSDTEWLIGNVAASEHDAFERISFTPPHFLSVRCIRRLIETNIAQGHRKVAMKYIGMLESTLFYKDQAAEYRKILKEGGKTVSLASDRFIMLDGWYPEMEDLIASQPGNRMAVIYEGLSFLFARNVAMFMEFYERHKDKPSMNPLPEVFQQAVVAYYQQDESKWKENGVSDGTIERYRSFRKLFLENRRSSSLKYTMRNSYGDTFWYYLIFGR